MGGVDRGGEMCAGVCTRKIHLQTFRPYIHIPVLSSFSRILSGHGWPARRPRPTLLPFGERGGHKGAASESAGVFLAVSVIRLRGRDAPVGVGHTMLRSIYSASTLPSQIPAIPAPASPHPRPEELSPEPTTPLVYSHRRSLHGIVAVRHENERCHGRELHGGRKSEHGADLRTEEKGGGGGGGGGGVSTTAGALSAARRRGGERHVK